MGEGSGKFVAYWTHLRVWGRLNADDTIGDLIHCGHCAIHHFHVASYLLRFIRQFFTFESRRKLLATFQKQNVTL